MNVTIPFFVMSGGDGGRVKAALLDGARLRVQPLIEPWQGELGGVWEGFEGIGSATGTCSASEMVGPSTCAMPYEFRGLRRGEGGVPMCVSEEDGKAPWCETSPIVHTNVGSAVGKVVCCRGENDATRKNSDDECLGGGEDKTFVQAKTICEEEGWRVCRKAELLTAESAGPCGSGCGFDSQWVWADVDLDSHPPGEAAVSDSTPRWLVYGCFAEYSPSPVPCVCPNAGDVWDGVKSGFARLRVTSVTEDCPPGTYYEARAWTQEQASVLQRPFRPLCVPCPEGTFSKVVGATSSTVCKVCPPNSVSAAGSTTCSCVAGFFGPGDTDGGCTPCGANASSLAVSSFASSAAAEARVVASFSQYVNMGSYDDAVYSFDSVLTEEQVQSAAYNAARDLAGYGSEKTCVCNAGYTGDPVAGCTPCDDSGTACALTCIRTARRAPHLCLKDV